MNLSSLKYIKQHRKGEVKRKESLVVVTSVYYRHYVLNKLFFYSICTIVNSTHDYSQSLNSYTYDPPSQKQPPGKWAALLKACGTFFWPLSYISTYANSCCSVKEQVFQISGSLLCWA